MNEKSKKGTTPTHAQLMRLVFERKAGAAGATVLLLVIVVAIANA
jgi:hypothetical protein